MKDHTYTLMHLNFENLFLYRGKKFPEQSYLEHQKKPSKSLHKTEMLANFILKTSPDIIMASEVGMTEDGDGLTLLNEDYLSSQYHVSLIPGNSDRDIHVGFLLKKTLPFHYKHFTHKNRILNLKQNQEHNAPAEKFERDLAELHIYSQSKDQLHPKIILLYGHFKSKWDRSGLDPEGISKRSLEITTATKIYSQLRRTHPDALIMMAGDFNCNYFRPIQEFLVLKEKTALVDFLLNEKSPDFPLSLRTSYVHFQRDPITKISSRLEECIDFIFLDQNQLSYIEKDNSGIYHFTNETFYRCTVTTSTSLHKESLELREFLPKSYEEKTDLPTDHSALILQVKIPLEKP